MNVLSHALVTRKALGTECASDTLVGAMLPDVAGVASLKTDSWLLTNDARVGVRTHHAADSSFHSDRLFVETCSAMTATLESSGVGRGSARACSHVGFELMLDGAIEDQLRATVDVDALFDRLHAVGASCVEPTAIATWAEVVTGFQSRASDGTYRSAQRIAERLHELVRNRKRLAFDVTQIPCVSSCLQAHRPSVLDRADDLVARVAEDVRVRCGAEA